MADATALVDIVGRQSVSGPAGVAAGALSAVEAAAGKAGGVLTGLASTAVKAGAALGAIAAGGVIAGLTAATTAAAGFEKEMSAVGAVSGASATQMKELSSLALKLGADTSFSASESAQGIEELVKAGVSVADIMGGAAKASLDLAAAGGVSVADAAEIASNAMNVFSIKGKDMGRVADVIAGAANASAISVNDYKFSLAAAGAVANTVGIGFDDLSTSIAVMGQAGIKGSDAGTSLKTMLMNLQPSTKAQTEEFKRLGFVTKDGGNAFFDASGKAKSMAEIAGVLQKATAGMTQQQKLASLEILFGSDAIRAAAVLAKEGAAGFTEMAGAIGKVSAADVANTRLDNLAGSIEKFKGSAETAAITVGQHLTPPLRRLVDIGTDLINRSLPALDRFGTVLGSTFDALITRMTGAAGVGAFFSSLGKYLRAVAVDGDYLNDYLTELPPLFASVANAVAYVQNTVLPGVGRAFVELGQVVGGFLGLELDDYAAGWDTWGGIVRRSLDLAGTAIGDVLSAVRSAMPAVQGALTTLLPVVVAVGRAFIDNIVTTVRFVVDRVLPPLVSIIGQTATFFLGTLQPVLKSTGDVLRDVLGDSLTWLADEAWPNLLDIMGQTARFWQTAILPTLGLVAQSLRVTLGESVQWLAEVGWPALLAAATVAWRFFAGTVAPMLPDLAKGFRELLGGAIEWIGTTGWPLLVSAGQTAMAWITGTAVPAITSLVEWLGPKVSTVIAWISGTGWPLMVAAGQAASTWITGTALPALSSLVDWLGPKISTVMTWVTETGWPTLVSAGGTFVGWLTTTAFPAIGSLVEWLGPKVSAVVGWLIDTGWPTFVTAARAVSDWITGTAVPALSSLWSWLEEKTQPAVQWFIDTGWPSLQSAGQKVLEMWQGMVDWTGRLWDVLGKIGVWSDLRDAAGKLWDAGKTLVELFWPGMTTGMSDANVPLAVFAAAIKEMSTFIDLVATGVKAVADGMKALKDALSGMPALPDWFITILKAQGVAGSAVAAVLPQGGGQQGATAQGGGRTQTSGKIDNSSRASFVKTAYPYMLEAAGGNKDLAEMMLAAAISENGNVGSGMDFGGNNFFGIKGSGDAGSFTADTWEQVNGKRVNQRATFAAYSSPTAGFQAFLGFLQQNPRYSDALTRFGQTGDAEQLFRDINAAGYATDTSWGDTIASIRRTQVTPVTSNLSAADAAGTATRTSSRSGGIADMTQFAIGNQFELGLPRDQAMAACGPAAVAIFEQMTGRTPNAQEVMAISAKNGWTAAAGMGGPQAFANTLSDLGIQAAIDYSPTQGEAASSVSSGRAVAFSTSGGNVPLSEGHYFVAQGYDPSTGMFDFGETAGGPGGALAGGSRYMTYEQVVAMAGPVQALITLMDDAAGAVDDTGGSLVQLGNTTQAAGDAMGATARSASDLSTMFEPLDAALQGVGGSFEQAADGSIRGMARLSDGTLTVAQDTAGNLTGYLKDAAGNVVETFSGMSSDSVAQIVAMGGNVGMAASALNVSFNQQIGSMASGALTTIQQMGDDIVTTTTSATGDISQTVTDLAGTVIAQTSTMATTGGANITALGTAAQSATRPIDAFGQTIGKLPTPNLQPIADQFAIAEQAADDARIAAEEYAAYLSDLDNFDWDPDTKRKKPRERTPSSSNKRARGGSVTAGMAYLVGEEGPEPFIPSTNGYILPNSALSGGGNDGGIDYDKLARAVAAAVSTTRPVVMVSSTDEQARRVKSELARQARDAENLRGVR